MEQIVVYVVLGAFAVGAALTVAFIAAMGSLTVGLAWALGISLHSFVNAINDNLNAYESYVDDDPDAPAGVQRNYFFGPGVHQLKTIQEAAFTKQKVHLDKLTDFRDNHMGSNFFKSAIVWIFYIAAYACTFVYGYIWMGILSVLLSVVLGIGVAGFFVFFALLTGVDRVSLSIRAISSRCPHCHKISIIPVFECPTCGISHKKLIPGPYGIFRRECACGKKLPTTFFSGRSELSASCPRCQTALAASDAHQFSIQLVGGASAGKTTYLASFWHIYLRAAQQVPNLEIEISPEEAFDELEYWFNRGLSMATSETNANMYSVLHRFPEDTPLQFSFYDIAGEAFTSLDENMQQEQFRYCEGIIFAIDPVAPVALSEEALIGFLNAYRALKGKASTKLAAVPVAVVITKADLFRRQIGLPKIKAEHARALAAQSDSAGQRSIKDTRDSICRTFLSSHGFGNIMNLVDGEFRNVAIFPVSAIGHEAEDGEAYSPWGIMQAAFWILGQADEQSRTYFTPIEAAYTR